jgi:hypothetical protein
MHTSVTPDPFKSSARPALRCSPIGEVACPIEAEGRLDRAMADVTFRDFAGAIMQGNVDGAGAVLQQLLGLPADGARAAAQHFHTQSTTLGPAFMGKAMGLRTAVASGSDAEIGALLRDCFGLEEPALATAVATMKRPPA